MYTSLRLGPVTVSFAKAVLVFLPTKPKYTAKPNFTNQSRRTRSPVRFRALSVSSLRYLTRGVANVPERFVTVH